MSTSQLLVLLGGLAAILWVNWYFFLARRSAAVAQVGARGVQESTIIVRGGYSPAEIRVRRGAPVRLIFDRQETSSCSEELVFPAFNIRKFLPAHQRTSVEFTPETPGTFEFTCGMNMLRGKLVVE
jgi:plastocyanin domain-containing protein